MNYFFQEDLSCSALSLTAFRSHNHVLSSPAAPATVWEGLILLGCKGKQIFLGSLLWFPSAIPTPVLRRPNLNGRPLPQDQYLQMKWVSVKITDFSMFLFIKNCKNSTLNVHIVINLKQTLSSQNTRKRSAVVYCVFRAVLCTCCIKQNSLNSEFRK